MPWLPGRSRGRGSPPDRPGMARGTYFIPQIGDEVLVAFNHGDMREPYVIGCLWNTLDRPPAAAADRRRDQAHDPHAARPRDRVRRMLQSVTITSTTQAEDQARSPRRSELPPGSERRRSTLSTLGTITIRTQTSLTHRRAEHHHHRRPARVKLQGAGTVARSRAHSSRSTEAPRPCRPPPRLAIRPDHPGIIAGPGVPTVLIGGMPAAVAGDNARVHSCRRPPGRTRRAPIPAGSATVLIGGRPALAARRPHRLRRHDRDRRRHRADRVRT